MKNILNYERASRQAQNTERSRKITKEMAKELAEKAEKYEMEIMRNPVTSEAWGLWVDSDSLLPELDALTEFDEINWNCTREMIVEKYRYKLVLPTNWFDLWGWK